MKNSCGMLDHHMATITNSHHAQPCPLHPAVVNTLHVSRVSAGGGAGRRNNSHVTQNGGNANTNSGQPEYNHGGNNVYAEYGRMGVNGGQIGYQEYSQVTNNGGGGKRTTIGKFTLNRKKDLMDERDFSLDTDKQYF